MDYLKNVNIKKDINPIFFHGIFFKIVHPSKSPAWSGNSKSLKKSEIRPRDFWQIDLTCSGIIRPIQLYSKGVVTKLPYRLIGDMVSKVNLDFDLSTWSTQFRVDANSLTLSIFATLLEQYFLPKYTMDMIFNGDDVGVGVMNAEQLGPVSFITYMAKAICYALHGLPL